MSRRPKYHSWYPGRGPCGKPREELARFENRCSRCGLRQRWFESLQLRWFWIEIEAASSDVGGALHGTWAWVAAPNWTPPCERVAIDSRSVRE